VVQFLEQLQVADLAERGKQYWSGAVCLTFLSEFLSLVKAKVPNDTEPGVVYKFEYEPIKRRVMFSRDGDPKHVILPDWFEREFQE